MLKFIWYINSRLEYLLSKKRYHRSFDTFANLLKNNFNNLNEKDINDFMYTFFPYTNHKKRSYGTS